MKGKITTLLSIALTTTVVSNGQENYHNLKQNTDTIKTISADRYAVTTNRFWNNWFVNAGAGTQLFFNDHNKQMKFTDRLTPAYSFNIGKWFSPGLGVRMGASGLKIKGVTQNGAHSTGEPYDGKPWEGYWLENQEINYYHVYGDVLFNLMNMIGGYRDTRVYSLSPYVGLGFMVAHEQPKAREVSANIGLFNEFKLSKAWGITLDLRGSMVNDRFDGETGGRKEEGLVSGTVGLVYNFKKQGWDKPTSTIVTQSYDESLLAKLRDKIDALSRDNDALRQQLANASSETVTEVKVESRLLAAPILVTFPINQSVVSNEARVNLGFFAKVIKEGNSEVVYKVTGYADAGTGTVAINERLSRERAQAIYNVLVNEFAVSPAQLEVAHQGGVENMFYNDPRLSRAVITIAK